MGAAARLLQAPPPAAGGRLVRFASWGVVNTVVDLAIYVALAAAGVPTLVAHLASTSAGMAVSFYGNRRFVFGRTGRSGRELALFLAVCGAGVWLIQPAVLLLTTPLVAAADTPLPFVVAWLPKCLAIGIAAGFNFFLYKHVVFRHPAPPVRSPR